MTRSSYEGATTLVIRSRELKTGEGIAACVCVNLLYGGSLLQVVDDRGLFQQSAFSSFHAPGPTTSSTPVSPIKEAIFSCGF